MKLGNISTHINAHGLMVKKDAFSKCDFDNFMSVLKCFKDKKPIPKIDDSETILRILVEFSRIKLK